ncbi:MAG: BrnT family toxin [Gammaproteobacteria bacterium]|nr:BrnT family toxin [Gammaproteobacteria bacterium]
MKTFSWDSAKNDWLMAERGVSFERVMQRIEMGQVLDVVRHPNPERYPYQRMFIVDIDGYACLVPFVESGDEVFLKTIIPSRKATRRYLGGR